MKLENWLLLVVYPAVLVAIGPLYRLFRTGLHAKIIRTRLEMMDSIGRDPVVIGLLLQSNQGLASRGTGNQLIGIWLLVYGFLGFPHEFWARNIMIWSGSSVFGFGTADFMFARWLNVFYTDLILRPDALRKRLEGALPRK